MLKTFKKMLATSCALSVLMTGAASFQATSSHAAIGAIATGGAISVPVAIAAGSTLGLGLTYGIIVDVSWGDGMLVGTAVWSLIGLIIGGIILDDESGQVAFSDIDSAEIAAEIGLTEAETAAYHAELNQVNAVRETIEAEVAATNGDPMESAKALWVEYGTTALSSEAWSAVQKVSRNLSAHLSATRSVTK